MRTRFLLPIVLVALLVGGPVLAASYTSEITLTESAGTSYDMLGIECTLDVENLVDLGLLSAAGLDGWVLGGGLELPRMLVDDRVMFASAVEGNAQNLFTLSLGNTPANFAIVPGDGGYVTTADNANLEPGDDFTIVYHGYVDTSSDGLLLRKLEAIQLVVDSGAIVGRIVERSAGTSTLEFAISEGGDDGSYNLTGAATRWEALLTNDSDTSYVSVAGSGYYPLDRDELAASRLLSIESVTTYGYVRGGQTINFSHEGGYYYLGVQLGANNTMGAQGETPAAYTLRNSGSLARPGGGAWSVDDLYDIQGHLALSTRSYEGYTLTPRCTQIYVAINGYTEETVLEVSSGALPSGEYEVTLWADGSDLVLEIDGVEVDSVALGGASVPDTATSWVLYADPYVRSYNYYVGANHRIQYEPSSLIIAADELILNELSPGTYDGALTFGSNPADIDLEVGALLPSSSSSATTGGDEEVPSFTPDIGYDTAPSAGIEGANLPFYDLFKDLFGTWAELGGPNIDMAYFWKVVFLVLGWVVGTGALLMTRSWVFGFGGYIIGFAVPALYIGALDPWLPLVYGIGAICLAGILWKWTSSSI